MKVSFDLDGTAWKYRRPFIELALALKVSGHQVGILTAHSEKLRPEDMRLWQARGFPPPDFFYSAVDWEEERHAEGVELREAKIAFAKKMEIDIHIDDFDDRHPGEVEMVFVSAIDESEH